MIQVQVVYVLPEQPTIVHCQMDEGSTVLQAITQSNIVDLCHLSLEEHPVGIYGKQVELATPIADGDRIEIYRKLINDPKEIRRKRARLKKES